MKRIPLAIITLTMLFATDLAIAAEGRFFNPISDPDWLNYFFPITIAGVELGGSQPPTISEPAICVCPSHLFGTPLPGLGISYWGARYIAEISRQPGDLITLGGISVLSGYGSLTGPATSNSSAEDNEGANRAQVHWLNFDLMDIIGDVFSTECENENASFNIDDVSEVDYSWQNDLWAIVFSPGASSIAATTLGVLACPVDAAAASLAYPLDALFWCAGAWGPVYPFSGNPNSHGSDQQANALLASKYLAREFELGQMDASIGPMAICSDTLSPIWIKTEFRFDPIYPKPYYGPPIYIGQTEFRWGLAPPANYPTAQSSSFLLWQAHQCCLRF